ncbi:uncharacterized protein THITE_2128311 [Thermothielavioides terrestris NRRL 8126]|uniref:Uncharacterized protein n=2 Tax=Thermothielavioides terrestris TaxID=2587410 RepID=G2QYB9_THETT|nr:uncharacterized protein THITE_2128311 [Thermothielavioides terrestris NRRL 8126]AEO66217.1 hypothetical protein THITE_2128311 [Thermothielavioides terrestris NRRL 8126]
MQSLKVYWIDQSCHDAAGSNFDEYVIEARRWARRAYERLRNPKDTDFARVFNLIFKTPTTDKTPCSKSFRWQQAHGLQPESEWKSSYENVMSVLHDFAFNWARTSHREKADVRIYSAPGGFSRWKPDLEHKHLYDPINHVWYHNGADVFHTCQAFVSNKRPARLPAGMVLSLDRLDPALVKRMTTGDSKGKLAAVGLFSPWLLSRLLFHEFMHASCYMLDDHLTDPEGTSGWAYCMRRKKGRAASCAESLAMLGLWAALADLRPAGEPKGGFSVDRRWDQIPGGWDDEEVFEDDDEKEKKRKQTKKWDPNWPGNGALKGEMVFYRDLTN